MENKELFFNILFPTISGAVAWLTTRWHERGKFSAETASIKRGNDRSEIENYKLISIEWREAAQQWKNLVDEYQAKLIENAKKIDELYEQNVEMKRELATVKGQLTRANNRLKELEHNSKL